MLFITEGHTLMINSRKMYGFTMFLSTPKCCNSSTSYSWKLEIANKKSCAKQKETQKTKILNLWWNKVQADDGYK